MKKLSTFLTALIASAGICCLASSGPALAAEKKARSGSQDPNAIVVEYFCCDADGTCLPANKNSVCPAGFGKVVNKTCERGESGCDL